MRWNAWAAPWLVFAAATAAMAAPGGPLRPDLFVDPNSLASDWTVGFRYFPPGDCAINEGCVVGPGVRRLIVFTVTTANIGMDDLVLGDPTNSPFFQFDTCHQHYHLNDFETYEIRDASGGTLVASTKSDWCLEDSYAYVNAPWVPQSPYYTSCYDQGLQGGWADIYTHGIDCQWVDVTGLAPGAYTLSATVNPARAFRESDYSNNTTTTAVTLTDPAGDPDLTILGPLTSPTIQMVKRFVQASEPAVQEGCLAGGSYRRFFQFDTYLANLAPYDMYIGDPNTHPMMVYDAQHGHWHAVGLLRYELVDLTSGAVVASTDEKTWVPSDLSPYVSAPWVRSEKFYSVSTHSPPGVLGIQRGWSAAAFSSVVPCQVLDVTDVPDGSYQLRLSVNPDGLIQEQNAANNVFTKNVNVADPSFTGLGHRPDGKFVPGEPLRVEPAPGGLRITYGVDPPACPAPEFNLYMSTEPPGSYTYDSAFCDIGTSGNVVLPVPDPPPGGLLWMILVGRDGELEGGHGFDSAGRERPLTGIGFCGITESVPRRSCILL